MEDLLESWTALDELALEGEDEFVTHIPLPMLDPAESDDGADGGAGGAGDTPQEPAAGADTPAQQPPTDPSAGGV
ncbi:MAG: hypothetical protein U0271_18380 [Polyangiaceae bacterium]